MTQDPLAQLRDWHAPDPVSWWPPAPGWWVLAALVLVLLLMGGFVTWRWRRRRLPLRAACRQLEALHQQVRQDDDRVRFAREVSRLLRRVALARYPRQEVAGLAGQNWLRFLDAHAPEPGFVEGPGRVLSDVVFRPRDALAADIEIDALYRLAQRWIRHQTEGRT